MDINKLIVKAERIKRESELTLCLNNNLGFFKNFIPELYNKFCDYKPTLFLLSYDSNGYINLENVETGTFVYSKSPFDMSRDGVIDFIENPSFKLVRARASELIDSEDDIHHDTTNKAISILDNAIFIRNIRKKYYDFLIINGLGLGYVLDELISRCDINHIVIIEPEEDIFYAALHFVDWESIFRKFHSEDNSKSLNIVVGEEVGDDSISVNYSLDNHIRNIGIHHAVMPYILNHLSSRSIDKMLDGFFKRMNFTLSAAGFSDDEIWSIAHTVENWSMKYPVLQYHAFHDGMKSSRPVFVVANGPSLDQSIEFLKKNRDKGVIISCGTTIATLMKVGIKPDIHVEMERRYVTYEWLFETTTPEYRKGICFVGLNTVHPDVFKLFDRSYMAMKPLDLGSRYCNRFVNAKSGYKCVLLLNSNPTVGNMGVSLASALGFESVYLFGLDLAMSPDKEHHSKHSTYYEIDDSSEDEFIKLELANEESSCLEVEGNLCDKVMTSRVFMGSIICAEQTIKDSSYQIYFNTSNGARIRGAKSIALNEVYLEESFNTSEEVDYILSRFFGRNGLIDIKDRKKVSQDFIALEPSLLLLRRIFENPFSGWEDVVSRLDTQMIKVRDMDKLGPNMSCVHYVLKGSVSYWNLIFMQGLYRGQDADNSLSIVNDIRVIYLEYIDRTINKCKESLLVSDNKDTKLKYRLGRGK